MHPTDAFIEAVAQPAPRLDRLSALVAAHALPGLDVDTTIEQLDALATDFDGATPRELCRFVCEDAAFDGNARDYYDPSNSYLPIVLRRRTGIPLTLTIVAMEIGRRRGVPMAGVGMPGEFLIRGRDDSSCWWSLFRGPEPLDTAGVERLFAEIHGDVAFRTDFLVETSTLGMIERMLSNLAAIHQRAADLGALGWTTGLLAAIPGATADRQRMAAAVAERRGHYWDAANYWDRAGQLEPATRARCAMIAARLRARSN